MFVNDTHRAFLLGAMDDKFGAEHADIGVSLFAVELITLSSTFGFGTIGFIGVKGIGSGMGSDKAFAIFDGIQKSSFPGGGHRRVFIISGGGAIAGCGKVKSGKPRPA